MQNAFLLGVFADIILEEKFSIFRTVSFPLCQNIGQYISHCANLGKEMYLHATDFFSKIVKNFSGGSRISWTGRNIYFGTFCRGKNIECKKKCLNGKRGVPDPGGASAESPIIFIDFHTFLLVFIFTAYCAY